MKGDTLVEVLVALAVAVVVISAITTLGIVSLNNAQFIRDEDLSTKYAQEGMEVVRSLRNSSYVGFRNYNGTYCLAGNETTLEAGPCTSVNIFPRYIRSVTITQGIAGGCGANLANVAVLVSWRDTKCPGGAYCHSSKLTSCFSTIPPVSEP